MSVHTPGPWQVDPDYPIDVQAKVGNQEVCTPFYKGCEGRTISPVTPVANEEEALANARLIAAAPELLEALEGLVNADSVTMHAAMQAAELAITKAKGEA